MNDENEILNQSDNENENLSQNKEPEVKFETEGSTIFKKHEYNTKKPAKSGWTKRFVIAGVSLLLCVCIGLGAYIINKEIEVKDNTSSILSVTEQENIPVVVFNDSSTDGNTGLTVCGKNLTKNTNVTGAGVYNYYEEYAIMPYTVKTEKGTVTKWYVPGIDKDQVLSDELYDHVLNCMNIYATAKMENKYTSVEEYHKTYGVDDENCTRAFVATIGEGDSKVDLEIIVGKQVATRDGNYLRVVGDDTVYIVPSTYIANYDYLPSHFADLDMLSAIKETTKNSKYFTNNKLSRFDYIKISGKMLKGKTYEFGLSADASADFMPYVMTSPYLRPANEAYLENVLNLASSGIKANGLFSFSATAENMKTCGLDDPNCVIEAKIGEYYFKLTVGGILSEGSTELTAMINGKKQIFSLDVETFDFISSDISQMFNQNFIMEDIVELKSVTFKNASGQHKYNLTSTLREGTTGTYDIKVEYKGKTVSESSFKALYQRVLLLSLLSFVTEEEKITPELTITFEYVGNYKNKVVEFTQSPRDSYHYVAWVNGVPFGEVLKTSVADITDNLERFVQGGVVNSPM